MIDSAIISSEDNQTLGITYWNNLHLEKDLDGTTIILTFDCPIDFIPNEIYYVEIFGIIKFKGRLSEDRKQILEVDCNYASSRIKTSDSAERYS